MDCRVVVEAAVPVYDVSSTDEAVRIAIAKTGEMLNPDLSYVEIQMGERLCPHCGDDLDPAFVAADEALVALELEMTVFNVEREEHAERVARKEIGQRLENVPLDVLEVEKVESTEETEETSDGERTAESDSTDGDSTDGNSTDGNSADGNSTDGDSTDGDSTDGDSTDGEESELPEFDDLVDE